MCNKSITTGATSGTWTSLSFWNTRVHYRFIVGECCLIFCFVNCCLYLYSSFVGRGVRIVVGFTTTYAINLPIITKVVSSWRCLLDATLRDKVFQKLWCSPQIKHCNFQSILFWMFCLSTFYVGLAFAYITYITYITVYDLLFLIILLLHTVYCMDI